MATERRGESTANRENIADANHMKNRITAASLIILEAAAFPDLVDRTVQPAIRAVMFGVGLELRLRRSSRHGCDSKDKKEKRVSAGIHVVLRSSYGKEASPVIFLAAKELC